jgi:hypothetical protein
MKCQEDLMTLGKKEKTMRGRMEGEKFKEGSRKGKGEREKEGRK